jgi:hypothetical protein
MGLSHDWRHCRNGREATQQLVFTLAGDEASRLRIGAGEREWTLQIGDLLAGSVVELVDDDQFGGKIKFHAAQTAGDCRVRSAIADSPEQVMDYYYLRVIQENGQMAWSSPIWVAS